MDDHERVAVLYIRRRTGVAGAPPTYDVSLSADVSSRSVARVLATQDPDAVLELVTAWLAGDVDVTPRPRRPRGHGRAGSVTPR